MKNSTPLYYNIFFLIPDYVASRSLRSSYKYII